MASILLTLVGPDRPGLVRGVSEAVMARGGSWLESRMARLSGQFAGIVRVEAPEALLDDLPALELEGLRITATLAGPVPPPPPSGPRFRLEVVGNDRPGIVHDLSEVLAASGANIEALTTDISSSPFSGETLFRATVALRVPNEDVAHDVRAGLERLGNEMMVDIQGPEEEGSLLS